VASGAAAREPKDLEAELAETEDLPSFDDDLEELIDNLLDHHRHCAQADLDPAAAEHLKAVDADLASKELKLRQHRANVDEHRRAQEAILDDLPPTLFS